MEITQNANTEVKKEKSIITEEGLQSFQKASFIMFFIIGSLYIVLEILRTNGVYPSEAVLFQKSLDLPFAFLALCYLTSTLKIAFGKIKSSVFSFILITVPVVIFAILVYFNFFFQDK